MLTDLDQRQAMTADSSNAHSVPYMTPSLNNARDHSRSILIKISVSLLIVLLLCITGYYSYLIYVQRTNVFTPTALTQQQNVLTSIKPVKIIPVQPKQNQIKNTLAALPVITATNNHVKPAIVAKTQTPSATPSYDSNVDDEAIITIQAEDSANEKNFNTDIQSVKKQQLQLNPNQQAEVAYQKGYGLLQQNKIYSAEAKLLLALEHNAKHIKAREILVGLYLKTGRKVEAQNTLVTGLVHLPNYTNFTKLYARILLDNNQTTKAVNLLLQHKPAIADDPNYFALLAASYQRQKNHNAAANTYVKLLKLKPREGIWWVGMAISLEALHKKKDALNAYEKARQTGTLNTRISNYSSQRLQQLNLNSNSGEQ